MNIFLRGIVIAALGLLIGYFFLTKSDTGFGGLMQSFGAVVLFLIIAGVAVGLDVAIKVLKGNRQNVSLSAQKNGKRNHKFIDFLYSVIILFLGCIVVLVILTLTYK